MGSHPPTIAIDARYVTRHLSGIGRYTLNLLHGIAGLQTGRRFLVLALPDSPIPATLRENPAYDWLEVASNPKNPLVQRGVAKMLGERGVVLLHSPDVFGPMNGPFKRVATLHDVIPIVCRKINWKAKKSKVWWLWKWWLQMQCRTADAVITVSETSRLDIQSVVGLPGSKLHVVCLGIDDTLVVGDPAPVDPPMVLYVGRMDATKNVAGLVRAFAVLHEKMQGRVRLVIAGKTDPRFPQARREADRLGIKSAATFTDHISEERLHAYYREATVLAFPTLYEGFGLPPLEAMRRGLPVVASNRSCVPEILGDAAVLVDPTDANAFGAALHRVITDPELVKDLRARGYARAAKFTVAEQASQTLAVYDRVLGM